MSSEAHRKAVAKYDKANTRFFGLKLNRNTDKDIIEHLEAQESIQAYLKNLIREDISCHISCHI